MRALPLVALLAFASNLARAQEFNTQLYPVGEEAIGLSGAYTGWARDPSALFYNPAGLVFQPNRSVGATISLPVIDEYKLGDASTEELGFRDAFGVPGYVGGSANLEFSDGSRHALAFATFSQGDRRRRLSFFRDTAPTRGLVVERRDQSGWIGGGYGYRPKPSLGLGISGFVVARRFEHTEGEIFPSGGEERVSQSEMNAESLVFRVGAMLLISPQLSLGFMIQPPGIVLGSRARYSTFRADAGGDIVRNEETTASSPTPFQARAGIGWSPHYRVLITSDVIVDGPIGSESDPTFRFAGTENLEEGALGRYISASYHTNWTVNFALGLRVRVADSLRIAGGFFTSLSSVDELPSVTTTYQPDHFDVFGTSLSLLFNFSNMDFALGAAGAIGAGQGLVAQDVGVDVNRYVASPLESRTLYIFVRGANTVADAVGKRIENAAKDL